MTVTPLLANGRLAIDYVTDLPHTVQLLCNVQPSGTNIIDNDLSPVTGADAAAQFTAVFKAVLSGASNIVSWRLQRYASGAYVEIDTGAIGVAGTHAGGVGVGSQNTYTFRDGLNDRMALRILGANSILYPSKNGFGSLGAADQALITELLDTLSGHVGSWRTGRGGINARRFVTLVGSLNRKTRRRLGIV